jgi:L-serine dehydratase
MLKNENVRRDEAVTRSRLIEIWEVMQVSAERGMTTRGLLPGSLKLHRRAPDVKAELERRPTIDDHDPLATMDWIDLYALAIGEENAAGGRVVTAPTNGAAALIPSVMYYGVHLLGNNDDDRIARFLLTAAAIGSLYKENASISAADVGCQGEVGVACSMAAAALVEFRGGSPVQALNAAEIGMEHNLGLTCDPIGGLVQIPCIERNSMGAVKAINAARMALRRQGKQIISLDKVIETMRQTGADMSSKYKETAKGGLAVNVPEC